MGHVVSDLAAHSATQSVFIDEPRDPYLRALYEYWNALRGDRPMPQRADIDPAAIPKLLPHIMMYNVLPNAGGLHYSARWRGGGGLCRA